MLNLIYGLLVPYLNKQDNKRKSPLLKFQYCNGEHKMGAN